MKKLKQAKLIWKQLADIPINNSEEIELPFMGFGTGTDIYHIWHWIEDKFNVSIVDDLYNE